MHLLWWLCTLCSTLLAILAAWRWRNWKRRAQALQKALHALAYEVSNAANAARANLLDFRHANPAVQSPGHLDEIQTATDRLIAILRIADDPVAWRRKKTAGAA